ncbi:MAG TPA: Uma2 family endonuclease, partial [Caldithrix abyssi]|nr:Uma2 family endonuclease [Caldithrix abyssi]
YDLFDKKELYEQHGVKEYWLVDPLRQWADVYVLKEKNFELVQHREKEGALHSSVLKGFKIDLPRMFAFDM